jgi:hypothetical protein
MDRPRLSESPNDKWTSADDYVAALARKRTARRGREPRSRRTQGESPRFGLSTLPYVALIAVLLVLTIAIAVAAFPGLQPLPPKQQLAAHEQGVAEKGWLQDAEREFHR